MQAYVADLLAYIKWLGLGLGLRATEACVQITLALNRRVRKWTFAHYNTQAVTSIAKSQSLESKRPNAFPQHHVQNLHDVIQTQSKETYRQSRSRITTRI